MQSLSTGAAKVKVLLAQALFGNPDILLLDEPTNHLDLDAIAWLEEFLINFENTVIVVSHDRYFLNKVCTNIADMDYGKIQLYAGNYDFWYESSQLLVRQMKEANKKKEEKIKELQEFISRFSANASKSKQATSRKRALEKIQLDDIRPSSRKYPYIDFRPNREIGNEVLTVDGISKTIDGVKVLDNISFIVGHDDKIAFVGGNELAKTTLFKILAGEMEPDEGSYKWGVTTSQSYFPKDNTAIFDSDELIVDWLTQYSEIKLIMSRFSGLGQPSLISAHRNQRWRFILREIILACCNSPFVRSFIRFHFPGENFKQCCLCKLISTDKGDFVIVSDNKGNVVKNFYTVNGFTDSVYGQNFISDFTVWTEINVRIFTAGRTDVI